MEYPSKGKLYLDGHPIESRHRRSEKTTPIKFQYASISESSRVPYLFSPLVVTGEKALLLPGYLELIVMDATR